MLRLRCMGVGQNVVQARRESGRKKSNILLTFGSVVSSCAIDHRTRLQSLSWALHAPAEQEGPECCSRTPTKDMAAKGKVQTSEEAKQCTSRICTLETEHLVARKFFSGALVCPAHRTVHFFNFHTHVCRSSREQTVLKSSTCPL